MNGKWKSVAGIPDLDRITRQQEFVKTLGRLSRWTLRSTTRRSPPTSPTPCSPTSRPTTGFDRAAFNELARALLGLRHGDAGLEFDDPADRRRVSKRSAGAAGEQRQTPRRCSPASAATWSSSRPPRPPRPRRVPPAQPARPRARRRATSGSASSTDRAPPARRAARWTPSTNAGVRRRQRGQRPAGDGRPHRGPLPQRRRGEGPARGVVRRGRRPRRGRLGRRRRRARRREELHQDRQGGGPRRPRHGGARADRDARSRPAPGRGRPAPGRCRPGLGAARPAAHGDTSISKLPPCPAPPCRLGAPSPGGT